MTTRQGKDTLCSLQFLNVTYPYCLLSVIFSILVRTHLVIRIVPYRINIQSACILRPAYGRQPLYNMWIARNVESLLSL